MSLSQVTCRVPVAAPSKKSSWCSCLPDALFFVAAGARLVYFPISFCVPFYYPHQLRLIFACCWMWRVVILCIGEISKGQESSLTRWHFLAVPVVVACCIFAVIFLALHSELISPVFTWKGCGLFLLDSQCLFLFQCWTTDQSPGQARSAFQDIPWSSLCYWNARAMWLLCQKHAKPLLCVTNTQDTFWGHISGLGTRALIVSQPSICWGVEVSRLHFPPTLILKKWTIVTLVFVLCK